MGERVNGVLYLDRIPRKNFSKQLVLDVSEWNFQPMCVVDYLMTLIR